MLEEHYLKPLFEPESVAVFGASDREDSVGQVLFANLLQTGFGGRLFPINPKHEVVQGQQTFKSLHDVPGRVDLAIICTPAMSVPGIIEQCGERGVRFALIVSSGFAERGHAGAALERKVLEIARSYSVRILGPNSLGIMRPPTRLNATFTQERAHEGKMALVSQSGAICSAILDWALPNKVGFSSVVSLGRSSDIDFGEILDYLVHDPRTHYILLYIEGIQNARLFLSALRSAARIKPILLYKTGRFASGTAAALTHSGIRSGSDTVFDMAVRRAGVVRVNSIIQLIEGAKALNDRLQPKGKRLLIITNGGGPGAIAADRASEAGIPLAELQESTVQTLNKVLPTTWSHANPVDIGGDANPARYRETIALCAADDHVDGLLVMLTPQAMTKPMAVAEQMVELSKELNKPLIACWMGEEHTREAREFMSSHNIPVFRMPESSVDLFSNLSTFYENQRLLLQTPAAKTEGNELRIEGARMLIDAVLAEKRKTLSEMESKSVLRAFKIPVAQTMVAHSVADALMYAEQLGFPIAMKVDSPDILRKTDAGGVRLNIQDAVSLRNAYHDIIETVKRKHPNARISGVSIEPFVSRNHAREVRVGVFRDRTFGPVITFGSGGNESDLYPDRGMALPPLNQVLAESLVKSTRAFNLLKGHGAVPAADIDAIYDLLLHISDLVSEIPQIIELDINPLIVDEEGVIAADARIVIDYAPTTVDRYAHMAIHPYPNHLVEEWILPDGASVTIRPVRPEDAEMEKEFVKNMSDESRYFRFMDTMRELSKPQLVRFTQIDYDREMAFVAVQINDAGIPEQIGASRYVTNPDGETVVFALAVADSWQKRGLGRKLMQVLIDCARTKGYSAVIGDVLSDNTKMLNLMSSLGFKILPNPEDNTIKRVVKPLTH